MRDISRGLNQGMHTANRVNEFTVKHQTVNGKFIQGGVGESSNDILFPVKFLEKPYFSFGGELTKDSSPTATMFPTISVVVLDWNFEQTDTGKIVKRLYVGATLGVVTTGVNEKMTVHWRFEGSGIVNPFGTTGDSLTDVI
jgi:hypothetical protein